MEFIELNISTNIWAKDIKQIAFDKQKFQYIIDELISSCKDKLHYNSAYQYDKHVNEVLNKVDYDSFSFDIDALNQNKKHFIQKIILKMLREKSDMNNWYDAAYSAYRSLQCMHAYSIPQFIEAKINSIISNN